LFVIILSRIKGFTKNWLKESQSFAREAVALKEQIPKKLIDETLRIQFGLFIVSKKYLVEYSTYVLKFLMPNRVT
jgi:hypothetical protein